MKLTKEDRQLNSREAQIRVKERQQQEYEDSQRQLQDIQFLVWGLEDQKDLEKKVKDMETIIKYLFDTLIDT